jgi:hypothetical protein
MKIILPKTFAESEDQTFFLLGPIKGGGDWQHRCCMILHTLLQTPFNVAVPCRWKKDHPLYQFRAVGNEDHFPRQLNWERYYLVSAARFGCIIAWLPNEDQASPRNDGQPYARDTYGELGEWRGRLMYDRTTHFAIGAEPNFPGLDVISRNFSLAIGEQFKISQTLEDTVLKAIEKCGIR